MIIRSLLQSTLSRTSGALRAAVASAATVAFAFGATPASAIEPVQRIVSASGIQALLIESHDVGVISLRVSFAGGAAEDPADKPGVASLAGYMFNEGAGDLDTQELMRQLARIGATFGGEATQETLSLSLATSSAHREEAFGFFKAALRSPRFDADALERSRRMALAGLEQERADPGTIAVRRISNMLYGKSRYTLPLFGTPESLASITGEDLAAYRRRVFARSNLHVAVAGDIDAATLATLLDDVFAGLPEKAEIQQPAVFVPGSLQQESIAMDLPQTIVMFANLTPTLDARQSLAASLFNQILSAQFTGRLFMAVREREGLVYSVGTTTGVSTRFGSFYGSLGAAPQNAERALALTMSEIQRLVDEGPTTDELEDAKAAFRGGYYLGLDTSDKLSAMLISILDQKLPDSYLADFDSMIAGITIDEVKAAGKLVARPDAMAIVSVGQVRAVETTSTARQ